MSSMPMCVWGRPTTVLGAARCLAPTWLVSIAVVLTAASILCSAESAPGAERPQPPSNGDLVLTDSEAAWIASHPTIRIQMSDCSPPFEYREKGVWKGIAYEYLLEATRRVGLKLQVVEITWAHALESIQGKRDVDLLLAVTRSPEREAQMALTKAYLCFPQVIFTTKQSRFVSSIGDLEGSTIAVENEYVMAEWLRRDLPSAKLVVVEDTATALNAVSSGQADAYVGNLAVASYLIDAHGLTNMKVAAPTAYGDEEYAVGIRKDWPELAPILNKGFDSIPPARKEAIRQKSLAVRYEYGWRTMDVLKWVLIVAGVALIFIVQLRRMVRRRTTELKDALIHLRASEESLGLALRGADLGTWDWNVQTGVVTFNERWVAMLGYSLSEIEPNVSVWEKLLHPDDKPNVMFLLEAHLAGRTPGYETEHRLRHKSGAWVWVLDKGKVIERDAQGHPLRAAGTHLDITERKRVEEARQESEQRFRAIFDSTFQFTGLMAADGILIEANQAALEFAGAKRQETVNRPFWETHWWRGNETRVQQLREAIQRAARGEFVRYEVELQGAGDRTAVVDFSIKPIFDPEGKVVLLVPEGRDITSRKQVEQELQKLASVVRFSGELINLSTLDGRMTFLNEAGARMLGIEPEEVNQTNIMQVIPDHLKEKVQTELLPALREGGTWEGELQYRNLKTGKLTDVHAMTFTVAEPSTGLPLYLANVSLDITERKRTEAALRVSDERLRQAEKMAAIGQLAGGVAHDFNNQLTGIMGYADMLATRLEDERLRNYAQGIVVSARRAADLTQQLLAFSRKGKYLSVPVNIHQLLGEVVAVLGRTIDKRIRISQLLRADRPVTMGDPTQLQNAILNVALNARDAMPQGGELTFETDVVTLDEAYSRSNPYEIQPGQYLCVSITDTGCGMTDEVKNHLFEPFFTTKKPGKGTGMGLASLYGTVRNHHGAINVRSEVGHGTTIRIWLPLAPGASEPEEASVAATPARGMARILLVDDEETVRQMASEMLRDLGHSVATCAHGREAVEYYRANWPQVDLVILDMTMPEMGGRDAFIAMRQINPRIRALLSSGYSLDGEAQGILNEGVSGFVGKPYRQAELSRSVAEALAR